jgi:hypothetical protein
MVCASSVVPRITACYDWLFVILALLLAAYTCKCLEYCLSTGVQETLSIRAREIGNIFAATGQIPAHHEASGPGLNDRFISVHTSGGPVPDLSWKPQSHIVVSGSARRDPHSLSAPTTVVRTVHDARFLVATARSTFKNKQYVVEVRAPIQPIKALYRKTTVLMMIGLVVGLAFATWGSFFFVKRALVPVKKIALAVQTLPVVHPGERIKASAVREQIESLCVIVNGILGQLEDSFQIGTGLPVEAFYVPSARLREVRQELANLFESQRLSNGFAETLWRLLNETERLSDICQNFAKPYCEDTRRPRTERLRFYLGGLATSATEHICVLIRKLETDVASEARDPSNKRYLFRW